MWSNNPKEVAPLDEGAQSDNEADLRSRLLVLESKLEEIKQLLSQTNSVESDITLSVFDRRTEFFPTYYVTLVSIIQAAALGYLLLAAKDQLSYVVAGTYDPLWTVLILGMFIMIVATWESLSFQVTIFRRRPTTLATLVPFCFGATQALVIFCISMHQLAWFYFAMTASALVGLISLAVMQRDVKLHPEYEENRIITELYGRSFFTHLFGKWQATRPLIFFFFGMAEALFNLQSLFLAIVVLILNAVALVLVHVSMEGLHQAISELPSYRSKH